MPLARFWKAEEYHQGYFRANPYQGYCQAVVAPKVLKARDKFALPPEAIARAIVFAIEQPSNVDVNEIIVRPTAQT